MVSMGYETPDMTQGYPFSYMSNAQAIGLLDGVNMVASTDALRGEDAQVIYNAMFTDYARGAMLVNTTHGSSVEVYPTLAESQWNLTKAAVGKWEKNDSNDESAELSVCKAHSWVIIGAAQDEEDAFLAYPIDDNSSTDLYDSADKYNFKPYKFKYEGTSDISSIVGYKVELWGEGNHGEPTWEKNQGNYVWPEGWTIQAIKTVKGQASYDYNASMSDSKAENGTIELSDKSLDLASAASNASKVDSTDILPIEAFVDKKYNGESIGTKDDGKVETALNVRDGAQYKLMDWDGDDEVDWVVVSTANYYKVESVSSKRAVVSAMKSNTGWETSTTSEKNTWNLDSAEKIGTNEAGKDIKIQYEVPDGLAEGDVVEVTYSVSYSKDKKAQLITATVSTIDAESKSLDKVSTKGGLTLTFDDEEIKVAQDVEAGDVIVPANPAKYEEFNSEEVGVDFDLYLNRNGFIVYSDYTTETASYAMVLDTADGKDVVGDRKLAKVDLLTGEGKHLKDVELTASATIDGTDTKRKLDESEIVGKVFKYWTNEDGQITKMTSAIQSNDTTLVDYKYDADSDRIIDATDNKTYVASLEDANVIFAVKSNGNVNSTNAGYIEYVQPTDGTAGQTDDKGFYVDVDNVIAVNQADIPDISATDDTNADELDNKSATAARTQTWLGVNNDIITPDYTNSFIAKLNANGDASAAILGVSDFNKFGAGETKIALVSNVGYSKTTDGSIIEIEASYDGKAKEIVSSAPKSDFDDIVSVYVDDAGTNHGDHSVGSETSATHANSVFSGDSLKNALSHGAAYAEIKVDADGKLTKVTFLDNDASGINTHNLVGHYYTVSRNVVTNVSEKKISYVINDGDKKNATGVTAIALYAGANDKLYSIDGLPSTSGSLTSDTKYYTMSGAPTRNDQTYTGTTVGSANGFYYSKSLDIEAAERGDVDYSMPDAGATDYYSLADIVTKASSSDVIAVYAFEGSMKEVDASNVVLLALNGATSIKAGDVTPTRVDATTVTGQQNTNPIDGIQVTDSKGNDVSSKFTFTKTNNAQFQITAGADVPAGDYTLKVKNGTTVYDGGMKLTVNKADTYTYDVKTLSFQKYESGAFADSDTPVLENEGKTFTFKALGDKTLVRAGTDAVTNLTAANIQVLVNGAEKPVASLSTTSEPGVYKVTMQDKINDGDSVKVVLVASEYVTANGGAGVSVEAVAGQEAAGNAGNAATIANAAGGAGLKATGDSTLEIMVTDAEGQGVTGLTAEDFTVYVGGYKDAGIKVAENQTAGKYQITLSTAPFAASGTADVSITVGEAKIDVKGVSTNAPSIGTVTLRNFKLGSDSYSDVAVTCKGFDSSKLKLSVDTKLEGAVTLDTSSGSAVLKFDVAKLNALAVETISNAVTLSVDGDSSIAEQKANLTVEKADAVAITAATLDKTANTLTITLGKDISAMAKVVEELKGETWTIKTGSSSAFNALTNTTPTDVTVNGDKIIITFEAGGLATNDSQMVDGSITVPTSLTNINDFTGADSATVTVQ